MREAMTVDCKPTTYKTLPGMPRAARPSGRFAEGKTPQRGLKMKQRIAMCLRFTMINDMCAGPVARSIFVREANKRTEGSVR